MRRLSSGIIFIHPNTRFLFKFFFIFVLEIKKVNPGDEFSAALKVCEMIEVSVNFFINTLFDCLFDDTKKMAS